MNAQQTPWVILNAALTADGKIDTVTRKGAKISSDEDWRRVDRLRAEVDAVMVGGNTLLAEDPRLTIRSDELRAQREQEGRPANPAKVGIISEAGLDLESRFLNDGGGQVFLFTTSRTRDDQITALRQQGAQVFVHAGQRVDLTAAMAYLKTGGIDKVLLEGGGTLNSAMFEAGLIDEVRLYIAPLIFGGASAPTLADGPGLTRDKAISLELKDLSTLSDGGILAVYHTGTKSGE